MSVELFRNISLCDSLGGEYRLEGDPLRQQTLRIMEMIKPYFLSPYTQGYVGDREIRIIRGRELAVERANHGLAHGLRQGALAKDIFDLLVHFPLTDTSGIVDWARRKEGEDPQWAAKIEIAASFQRSGRQSECSSASDVELYKKYEMQDTVNFRRETRHLFADEEEHQLFAEAILWSNPGLLDEKEVEDLKYIRRILHAAHTFDLRRILVFDGERIQRDAMEQLFGGALPAEGAALNRLLWERSGAYLEATGDRDLVLERKFQDRFFTQTHNPIDMVDAIHRVRQNAF